MSKSAAVTGVTCALLAAATPLAPHSVHAAVTNEDVVVELLAVANNNVTTNAVGWTLNKIGRYSDPVLQFNAGEDWIRSPDFGVPVLRLEFGVRCSASAGRRLVIADESTGDEVRRFALCAVGNKDEEQSFEFTPQERLSQFRLKINTDYGNTGNWGVGRIVVVTADPVFAPTGIAVVRTNANYFVLGWVNGANTVSNRVDVYRVERGAGETALFETGFDDFYGNDGSTKDFSNEIPELLGDAFSGERVYGAAGTNGICQLGTNRALGILRYDGISDYSNVVLRLRAKRYPEDNDETMIVSVDSSGATNQVETITLGEDYTDYEIDLSSITNQGSALLIGYYTSKSNRRVLLDSMSIVRKSADRETFVGTRSVPAAAGSATFRLPFDLTPKEEYRFSVRAINGDGIMSDAATVEVRALPNSGSVYYIL